jgi:hypothetical protein
MSHRIERLADGVSDRWVMIYALCEPIEKWRMSDKVRYVGKTVHTPWKRVREHSYAARKDNPRLPVSRWLKKQMAAGMPFHIWHLEQVPPGDDWAEREKYWIAKFREEGACLLNITDGGEGQSGRRLSEEHRARIAAAVATGANFECETCGNGFWRKRNEIEKGNNRFCSRPCYAKSLAGVYKETSRQFVCAGVEAAAKKRRAQTHCKRGHLLSGENLYLNPKGLRVCRECRKIHKARYSRARADG